MVTWFPHRVAGWPSGRRTAWLVAIGLARATSEGLAATGDGLVEPWVADTSVDAVRQTRELSLGTTGGRLAPDRLGFELGFSTREVALPGRLFDSLSLSIRRADGTGAALVATADTFGLTLAPTASGALAGGGVFAAEVPHLLPPLDGAVTTFAYQIEIQLPGDLVGQDLRADFDLFGNGDSVVSRGYGLALPEPDGVWLLALGGAVLGTVGWWRRRS